MANSEYPHDDDSVSEALIMRAGSDLAREMYRSFLSSDYPDALEMARAVLRERPDDVMAHAIVEQCESALTSTPPSTMPGPRVRSHDSVAPRFETGSALEATAAYGTTSTNERSRQMCQRFLESDHPAALELSRAVLAGDPSDRIAGAIAAQCAAALADAAAARHAEGFNFTDD
jgi:hypothetical protein